MSNKNWTRKEHIVAFNLYCKIPFSKINQQYPPIIELSEIIGRTKGSVAMKLANFARLDPALQARNISGLTRGAKGEEQVWNEFHGNWEELAYQSEQILAEYKNESIENIANIDKDDLPSEGKTRKAIIKARVNQSFFRKTILASYNNHCCITGISIPEVLVASHIIPWSKNEKFRMYPSNGLCLNALHDRAFDKGLMTITPNFHIKLSDGLLSMKNNKSYKFFVNFENQKIKLPQRFYPNTEFLEYHNKEIFIDA